MNKKAIPLTILFQTGNHATITYWLQIRALYQHPIINNFTYESLAKDLNCSVGCLHRHIKRMIQLGWCSIDKGVLRLTGLNKLKEKKECCVLIPVRSNKKDIILELRAAIIIKNLHNQQRKIAQKKNVVRMASTGNTKAVKAISKAGGVSQYISSILTLSNRMFGSLVNRSRATGIKIQQAMRKLGLINVKSRFEVLVHNIHPKALSVFKENDFRGGVFYNYITGCIERQCSNSLSLPCR